MIKIILSLFILAITFTGLACASASSDFNVETVEMDQDIYGINETIDIIDENDEVVEVNGNYEEEAAEVIINDTHEDKKNSLELENNTHEDKKNSLELENDTHEEDSGENYVSPYSKLQARFNIPIPDLDVNATKVSTGNRIDDAITYYSAYYNAYKASFPAISIGSITALIYKDYNEKDTIDIVSGILCKDRNINFSLNKQLMRIGVENFFYTALYYDPSYVSKYSKDNSLDKQIDEYEKRHPETQAAK